jgi:hypothetical protein
VNAAAFALGAISNKASFSPPRVKLPSRRLRAHLVLVFHSPKLGSDPNTHFSDGEEECPVGEKEVVWVDLTPARALRFFWEVVA